jgi:hypothetical protein
VHRKTISALILFAVVATATAGLALARSGPVPAELRAVRSAVGSYHSFDQAAAAGYSVSGEPCISSPAGTMGIHAVNGSILASGVIDPLQPPILLYLPREDGSLRLVAVEYLAVALANTDAGPAPWFASTPPPNGFFTSSPSVLGQSFDGPMPGHSPQMPWHYDLHAWVIEDNPAGMFAPFNPALSCP